MRHAPGHKIEPNPKAYTRKPKHPKEDDPEEVEYMNQWSSGFLNGLEESLYQSTCLVRKWTLKPAVPERRLTFFPQWCLLCGYGRDDPFVN